MSGASMTSYTKILPSGAEPVWRIRGILDRTSDYHVSSSCPRV
jgi:hypothetical protein